MKAPCLQTVAIAVRHHVLHRPQQLLQFTQHPALEVAHPLARLPGCLHLVERPFPVTLVDRLAERRRATEVAVGQELDLAHTELRPGEGRERTHAHIRSGHFHAVRCGEGRKNVKVKWFRPTVVRPDLPFV